MRKLWLVALLLIALAAWLYQVAGVRLALDGSGYIPRFLSTAPDYDALDADRERQRHEAVARPEPSPALRNATPATAIEPPQVPAPAPQVDAADAAAAGSPVSANPPAQLTPAAGGEEPSWADFRGAERDGRYRGEPILTDWSPDGLTQLWKHPIGLGYASFVVAGDRAFTIEQRRNEEVVAAYDVATGRELWTVRWEGEFRESMGGNGPRATPTYHDGRLYALGAFGELRCLNAATGEEIWRVNILEDNDARNLGWGMSAAPLIVDDTVVVLPGGPGGNSVVAYHRVTGERVWSALDDRQAYTSPMLVTIAGVRQILIVSATRALGLTPDGTRVLWDYPWPTSQGINTAQPLLLGADRVFLSASYGQGAAVFEVVPEGDGFATRTIWENQRMKNKFTSSVLHEGYIYGLDESILACVDAATGEVQWKAGRYGYGQIMIAGDRLIVLTEDGEVVQVRATPERHEELGSFQAIEGKTWNHPVIADGRLLVRNIREMAAFDIGAE
ncbi:MAG: PQQ-binding-like beta-propeller repeat protein [Vicinamibacterales bacterium]